MPENKDTDDDVQKGFERFDKEIDEYIIIKEKLERNFGGSKPKTSEEREFQLDVVKLQLKYDSANLVMTVILSLIVSLLAVIATIIYSGVFKAEVISVANAAFIGLIALTVLVSVIIALVSRLGQNIDINKIRKKFNLEEKKPKN